MPCGRTARLGAAIGVLLALSLVGLAAAQPATPIDPAAPDQNVTIDSYVFGPNEMFVIVGTTVTWGNNQVDVPHTTTSNDGLWDSGSMEPGGTFAFAFEAVGDFAYACTIHPGMTAVVHVVSDATELPTSNPPASSDASISPEPQTSTPTAPAEASPTSEPTQVPTSQAAPTSSLPAPTAPPYHYRSY